MTVTVSTFYKFSSIEDPRALQAELAPYCCRNGLKGTILIAYEGINATVSGSDESVKALLARLRADPRFDGLVSKESFAATHPFRRMKVRLKREIVTLGVEGIDPSKRVGTYVKPEDWNALIREEGVIVLDTRNAYETGIGTFEGALDPKTQSFRQFPEFVKANLDPSRQPRVAMFCTGGIRCEKASAYMLEAGFPEVYHLEGGILKYLETIPPEKSLWRGECYVFDERVALEHGVTQGTHTMCLACGHPLAKATASCPNCRGRR